MKAWKGRQFKIGWRPRKRRAVSDAQERAYLSKLDTFWSKFSEAYAKSYKIQLLREMSVKCGRNKVKRYEISKHFDTQRICFVCGETNRIHYHHIIPITDYRIDLVENICPLCEDCHSDVHGFSVGENYGYARPDKQIFNTPPGTIKAIDLIAQHRDFRQ